MGAIAATLGKLAIQAAPSIINGISTAITNRQQKKFALQQYDIQRKDNLSDWNRQNEYNSPISQMTRLGESGLNPNLIYKNGATNQAGEVSRAQMGSYNPQAPNFQLDIADTLNKYQNYENQKLQSDNLKQALQVAQAQEQYIQANTLNRLKDTDSKAFNIYKGNTLLSYQTQAAAENIRNTSARTDVMIDTNKRNWILSANKPEETLARIAQIKAQTSKVPFEKQLLLQNIEKLKTDNVFRFKNNEQKYQTNQILQQSALLNNGLKRGQQNMMIVERDIKNIEKRLMDIGVSKTQTTELIKSVLGILDIF